MGPGQNHLPSDSIKVVPGRSKLRVESSNPVPRGNSVHKSKKVKLISAEEAIHLSSGVAPMVISPPRRAIPPATRATHEKSPRPILRPPSGSPRLKPARVTFELPTPALSQRNPEEVPRPVLGPASEGQRRKSVFSRETPEEVTSPASETPKRKSRSGTPDLPRRVIVLALPALSATTQFQFVRKRSNPRQVQSRMVEPPVSPRALQIRSRIKQYPTVTPVVQGTNVEVVGATATATPVVQGTTVEVVEATATATQLVGGTTAKVCDIAQGSNEIPQTGSREISQTSSKEIPQSSSQKRHQAFSDERTPDLVLYRPAEDPTWNGQIMGSAMMPGFDCEFWGKPASKISRKAYKLATEMPKILKGELLPVDPSDAFGRSPSLSDVIIYFFPDEKETERERPYLFESSDLIRVDVNGTELLIFSSKVLDATSQYLINTQKKIESFLCGCFRPTTLSDERVSDLKVPFPVFGVDMDLKSQSSFSRSPGQGNREASSPPPGYENSSRSPVRVKIEVSSPSPGFENPSRSPVRMMSDVSVPPGYEKIWTPPSAKLNIQGTSNSASDLAGFAGLVRDLSGKWVCGYSWCNKSMSELTAELLAVYSGLSILWDSGFRYVHLEITSREIVEALTTHSNVFVKRKSILDRCKDLILKEWKCDIYQITKEQNSCAEWLASRVEQQPQGLVFYEEPPRGLINLLEKDLTAA